MSKNLSVVLATRNEEKNIGRCLDSISEIADEIIIFDEYSTDKTVEIAKKYGAKVYQVEHQDNFHITKQKAIDIAHGKWILQLDADEVITPLLAKEIKEVILMSDSQIKKRINPNSVKNMLFEKHQKIIEQRDGLIDKRTSNEIVAFFIPRKNIFIGAPLIHGGVYPDPAIRLIKKGKARLPGKSVHEIMEIDGGVAWLFNDMEHYDSPTLERYIFRLNRYTSFRANQMKDSGIKYSFFTFVKYSLFEPSFYFFRLYIRHKGYMDGIRGFLWSAYSSIQIPLSYYKLIVELK